MATRTYTESEILALALAALQGAYPGRSVAPGSFLYQVAASLAQTLAAMQSAIADADRDGVPASELVDGILKSRASAARLDEWATVFGLPSNRGAGLFGRNGAFTAQNGAGPVLGTPGTIIPTGALLVDQSGTVQVQLVAGVTIGGGGSVSGAFAATGAGSAGNLAAGTVLRWLSPVPGSAATVTLTTGLSGGYDVESDLDLLARLLRHLQSPPKGGTPADIRTWAEASTDATGASLGIIRGFVFKFRRGMCSSDVVVTQAGSGQSRDPGSVKAAACQDYIDARRLPSESIKVVRPYFPTGQELTIAIKGVPSTAGTFDWNDAGGVAIVSGTTTTVVIVTALLPTSLVSAINSGKKPRIQIPLPSVSPVPYVRRIVSGVISGLNTTLTLDSALPTSPANSSTVYAGGAAVLPVAIAVLGYVDNVGPSQQSGLQDTVTDAWEAVVSVGRIAQAALGATDTSGARVLVYSPGVGDGVGVTIAVGNGSPGSSDYVLTDNVPGQGPQLPEVKQIIVLGA